MGNAVKIGNYNDGKPKLSYFNFLPGVGAKQDPVPAPLAHKATPTTPAIKGKKVPQCGYFSLPFDYCVGGFLMHNANNRHFAFATNPLSKNSYYTDPRGKKWPYAFQTRISSCCVREQDISYPYPVGNTPSEVNYKYAPYDGTNQGAYYQSYMEYVNYLSICNTNTANFTILDGYLFGFRNREYFHIDYDINAGSDSEFHPVLKVSSSTSTSYYLTLMIPCIMTTNVCDTKMLRVTDNQHGLANSKSYRSVDQTTGSIANYNIISKDGKIYEDVNDAYTEYTEFKVPSNILGTKVTVPAVTYIPDKDHYGTQTWRWNPTHKDAALKRGYNAWNNYAFLDDHVAKTELSIGIRVYESSGAELKPQPGQSINLNFDFTLFKQNKMGSDFRNPNDEFLLTHKRVSATIHVNGEFIVE